MIVRRTVTMFLLALVIVGAWLFAEGYIRRHPERMPWTSLSLTDPIGPFTGRKLAALTGDTPQCLALLEAADVRFTPLPPVRRAHCGYADGVSLSPGGGLDVRWSPAELGTACPVAAALVPWLRDVVQPAALAHLKVLVASIVHYGSYSCRRLYGRSAGDWSQHATADAIDVAGFRLADGQIISVQKDWSGRPERAAFLRAVRDGACDVFATVLSPDYNRAHADHLHFDQADRGAGGWRACR